MFFFPLPLLYKQTQIFTCTLMNTNKYILKVFYIQVVIPSFSCRIAQTQSVLSYHLLFFLCGTLSHRKTKSYFRFSKSLLMSLLKMEICFWIKICKRTFFSSVLDYSSHFQILYVTYYHRFGARNMNKISDTCNQD